MRPYSHTAHLRTQVVRKHAILRGTQRQSFHMHDLILVQASAFQMLEEVLWPQRRRVKAGRPIAVCVQLAQHRRSLAIDVSCVYVNLSEQVSS